MRSQRRHFKVKRLQFGGRRSLRMRAWTRYTVRYSMERFLTMGGGLLLLRDISDASPVLALISMRN